MTDHENTERKRRAIGPRRRWPRGAAVAWDQYLSEFVELCEPGDYPGTIVCRRLCEIPDGLGGILRGGFMMPLPTAYFVPATPLARTLIEAAR